MPPGSEVTARSKQGVCAWPRALTASDQQQQVLVEQVQLLPQRRVGLAARGRRRQVQVAPLQQHDAQGAGRQGAHAVAQVGHHAHNSLDHGQKTWRACDRLGPVGWGERARTEYALGP